MLNKLKISYRILLIIVGAIIGIVAVGSYELTEIRTNLFKDRVIKTEHLVQATKSLANHYHALEKSGALTREEAQKAALAAIKDLRYGNGKEYFWIQSYENVMILHPIKPEMNGKSLNGFKDPKGTPLFDEMVEVVKKDGAGVVHYLWPHPGSDKPVPKISYVEGFAPWGWIIGSGIYVDDVDTIFRQILIVVAAVSLSILALVIVISFYIGRGIASTAGGFLTQAQRAASEKEAALEALHRQEAEYQLAEERRRTAEMRAELEGQLHQARKLEAVGTLAGGVAHEINNMLLPIVGLTQLTRRDMEPESSGYRRLSVVLDAAQRAQRVAAQILSFSRSDSAQIGPINLAEAIRDAEEMLRMVVPKTTDVKYRIDAEDATVQADSNELTQILINLARNSVDAMAETGGMIEIALEVSPGGGETSTREAILSVRDGGCGMDEDTLVRIFDPFFTTKPVGSGTGMGLAVVHGIISNWGGTISVNSQVGEGTTFAIRLPLSMKVEKAVAE
jgi:signal transduction histidine kinase